MNILTIGCGNMGAAILSALSRENPRARLGVVDPNVNAARARLPAEAEVSLWPDVADAADFAPDVVLLAIKPQGLPELAPTLARLWPDALYISILAGIGTRYLSANLGTGRVVRVMPNLPALVGQATSVGVTGAACSDDDLLLARGLFEAVGDFHWLDDEDQIDMVTAVSGSGPGYLFAFAQHLLEAAEQQGLPPALAERLVRQTVYGSAVMLKGDPRSPGALKQAVASKGGTTQAGLEILEAQTGLPALLANAVSAAHQRAAALGSDMSGTGIHG